MHRIETKKLATDRTRQPLQDARTGAPARPASMQSSLAWSKPMPDQPHPPAAHPEMKRDAALRRV
jgi:hypothetical protein